MSEIDQPETVSSSQSNDVNSPRVTSTGGALPISLIEDHRQRWHRGERLHVEAYLEQVRPTAVADAELLDLIYNEVVLREEDGESPRLDEYLERFPAHSEALRAQFDVHKFLQASDSTSIGPSAAATNLTMPLTPPAGNEPARLAAHARIEPTADRRSATRDIPEDGAARIASGPAEERGDLYSPHVEGFEIVGKLGSGGMGTVYRAFDHKHRRQIALKTLNRVGAGALLRFKNEFRTLRSVAHPNLVTLYELIGDGHTWFLTMELLDGVDFLRFVRTGGSSGSAALELSRLRAALRQLAVGVSALHAAGKLHRDIKPSNVIVTREKRVVLLDFGLVAEQGQDGQHRSTEQHLVGTAGYMAPEQAAGRSVSAASDWYSVGVMLFEALTGRLPFGGTIAEMMIGKQQTEPPAPRELAPDVPEDLNSLCVALLRRRPEDRPSGSEVLRRLGNDEAAEDLALEDSRVRARAATQARGRRMSLVGRQRHHQALEAALGAVCHGRTVAFFLHGPSGAGKTALLQSFVDEERDRGHAIILTGRCYEQESVPYKALDSLIDALGRYLAHLPPEEATAVLPRDVGSLARVFPSLRRVEAIILAHRRGSARPDPQELRRRAFLALRELLARLGDRAPLILAVDDLQWGDVDSAALLLDLLRPPDAPVLLFLGTYRTEDRATSPFLKALFGATGLTQGQSSDSCGILVPDCRELAVEMLTHDEASALASDLLGETEPLKPLDRQDLIESVARESSGNPFFIAELVRHVCARASEPGETIEGRRADSPKIADSNKPVLDAMLWSRVQRLPEDARRVLELIAISGRPLRLAELSQCAELEHDERVALALLRAGRLIRSTGRPETDEVEAYHDRIRESVVAHLKPEQVRWHHHRLALALEGSGQADPEVLGLHFLGADLAVRAAEFFVVAAGRAADALAFERAIALYRRALELEPIRSSQESSLRARLGDALANAGRGADAAIAYLEAVPGAAPADAVELQRRAAMQFLISGHIDEGLATLRAVLATAGMTMPKGPLTSLASLLGCRALLHLRGLGFRERKASDVPAIDLTRVDICWTAGVGLSVVDTIRGATFQARGLLLSLKTGEPSRIARSLAMEIAHRASTGGSKGKTSSRLLEMAEDLAHRTGDAYTLAMVTLARGVAAYLEGRWRDAQENCDRAEAIFRDQCTGVAWELDTAHAFALWALSHLGEIAELGRRWPILLTEARKRGDLYAAMNLGSYLMSVVRLAADDPHTARAEVRETMDQWSHQGYHVQHNDAVWAAVQIELYCGAGQAAWHLIRQAWPALKRSLLLRVQFIRTSMHFLRARAALAAAAELKSSRPAEASALRAVAARAARKLERERMPCPSAYAVLIQGALAASVGDSAGAALLLGEATERFESVSMHLCSVSVSRRLGELVGGDTGQEAKNRADQWMTAQKIRNPARMASVILPALD
jgi:tetratricopeptide (TPR) repeat protein